jgi:hypothetical protein
MLIRRRLLQSTLKLLLLKLLPLRPPLPKLDLLMMPLLTMETLDTCSKMLEIGLPIKKKPLEDKNGELKMNNQDGKIKTKKQKYNLNAACAISSLK